MDKVPIVLLAAGSSERMGQTKQLLPWKGKTLIEFQIELLLKLQSPLVVVLGANSEEIKPFVQKYKVDVVLNRNWEEGMGSSVACGVKRVAEICPKALGVLLALADQPLIPEAHFLKLISKFQHGEKQIVASKGDSGWQGVPALFDAFYFGKLQQLNGEQGAKQLIRHYTNSVLNVNCGDLLADIDTPENYKNLFQKYN